VRARGGGAWGKGKESECEEWKTEGGGPTCAVAVAKRNEEVGRTAGNPRSGKRTKDRQGSRGGPPPPFARPVREAHAKGRYYP
jgi:hypothetical protein